MKLIQPPSASVDEVEVIIGWNKPPIIDRIKRFFGNKSIPKDEPIKAKFPGRIRFNPIQIDSEGEIIELGIKITELELGKWIFYGVIPFHVEAHSGYVDCYVDYWEEKKNGRNW
jgi:hypothetical protein